jgi:hypothetical protein
MQADALHVHHSLFSEATTDDGSTTNGGMVLAEQIASADFAIDCKSQPSDTVCAYVEAGIAPATRRAYKADLDHFRAWGGDIPTTDIPGHSLRAGFTTSATRAGVSTFKIRQQTGHASDAMLSRPFATPWREINHCCYPTLGRFGQSHSESVRQRLPDVEGSLSLESVRSCARVGYESPLSA